MVLIKVKKDISGGLPYLKNVCEYIHNPEKAIDLSGNGVNPYNPEMCYEQMLTVKNYYGKTTMNPLVHFIIGYAPASDLNLETVLWYTRSIASFYQKKYQTLQCTHRGDSEYPWFHTHILVNSVSFVDGRMFSTDFKELNIFSKWVTEVTKSKPYIEIWSKKNEINMKKITNARQLKCRAELFYNCT